MVEQPLVSVLMTCFNREDFLEDAIKSVMLSTYQHWELIIVDDVSLDNSLAIATSYANIDERIYCYSNVENLGDYPNRNKAASFAKGKYLIYCDADDMIYPFGIEQMVYYMEKFKVGLGICRRYDPMKMYPVYYSPKEAAYENFLGEEFLNNAPGSVIIDRSKFEEVGGFTHYRHISDTILWIKLALMFGVIKLPREQNWARSHADQELKYRLKKIEPIYQLNKLKLEIINSNVCELTFAEKNRAIANLKKRYLRVLLSKAKRFKLKDIITLIKKNPFA